MLDMENQTKSTFGNNSVQRMPIATAFNQHLELATGNIFALINATENTYIDKSGKQTTHTSYYVRVLNSQLLKIGTPIRITVKKSSIISEQEERTALLSGKNILLIFKSLKRWIINGNESLAADDVQIVNKNIKDVIK